MVMTRILTGWQRRKLREHLSGRLIALCFGAGVDSTAMMVALRDAGIRPDVITFANTGGEKPETLDHVAKMNDVLSSWGWPLVDEVRKVPQASTGYADLYGNCLSNVTLPSLAYGRKSCSEKWKRVPQDQFIKGVTRGEAKRRPHPVWEEAQARGTKIVKLIGYDCGKADLRRSASLAEADDDFDYAYPLQLIGWTRGDCVAAITKTLGPGMVPIKSACFFCPASKQWELYWLAGHHPALLEAALHMERTALMGRHSRFDEGVFGASWAMLVTSPAAFQSSKTCIGLGRSFSWNHWARSNGVVDESWRVFRQKRDAFKAMAEAMRGIDNAFDGRSRIEPAESSLTLERRASDRTTAKN